MSIDLLCNGVWATLSSALLSKFGDDLFVSGLPKLFHANYTSTAHFLRQLEDCVMEFQEEEEDNGSNQISETESSSDPLARRLQIRRRIESHPSTLELWKKWNLPVYFQLRSEEVKSAVDVSLIGANKEAYQFLAQQDPSSLTSSATNGSMKAATSSSSSSSVHSLQLLSVEMRHPKTSSDGSKHVRPLFVEGDHEPCMKTVEGSSSIKDRELNLLVMQQVFI
jgi:hypothetical protein